MFTPWISSYLHRYSSTFPVTIKCKMKGNKQAFTKQNYAASFIQVQSFVLITGHCVHSLVLITPGLY